MCLWILTSAFPLSKEKRLKICCQLVNVGSVRVSHEGLDLLVKTFAKVTKNLPGAVLLLVGGGEMEGELTQLVTDLQLGNNVVMSGRVSPERVPGVYAMVDILAYPRYFMRLTELVTPLKPLEAMAMGKALVASDVGGHKELINHGETGVLFKAGDVDVLASELEGLFADDERRDALQLQGLQWVREYQSREKTTLVYRDIYSKVLTQDKAV
jgi:glycosyltransferase involved in cell wall biosynthesis